MSHTQNRVAFCTAIPCGLLDERPVILPAVSPGEPAVAPAWVHRLMDGLVDACQTYPYAAVSARAEPEVKVDAPPFHGAPYLMKRVPPWLVV